jgi:hypothetical protein
MIMSHCYFKIFQQKRINCWKNQVRQTEFLVYFELDFYCLFSLQKSISNLKKFFFFGVPMNI